MDELFNYQKVGVEWLSQRQYALLALEMGLGKSAISIVAAESIATLPILVLCPAVARINWIREFSKFSRRTLTFATVLATTDAPKISSADVTICSYDLASKAAVKRQFLARRWSVCVLDEVHYLKSRTSARSRFVWGSLALVCDRIWGLSGTPAPNNPAELWPLLHAFGVYGGDYWSFVRRYCAFYESLYGIKITGSKRIDELRALIAPVVLRRKKEDVMSDMPPLLFSDVVVEPVVPPWRIVEMSFETLYQWTPDMRKKVFNDKLTEEQNRLEAILAGGWKTGGFEMLQSADKHLATVRRYNGLLKIAPVVEMVKAELEAGAYDKIVIFAVHKAVLTSLFEALRPWGSVLLYGGTPAVKRDRIVSKFQSDPKCRVFCGQVVAAGTAITLTAAHQVLVVEADWVPSTNQQAVARCHRIGQTKAVNVRFVGIAGSIDEKIQRALKQKTRTLMQLWDQEIDPFAD